MIRLSLPKRVPLPQAFAFATIFFAVELFQHTDVIFALLYFAFFILSCITFNVAEGFTRLTGAYCFWFSTLIVIFGVCWKVVVGEAAQTNLQVPILDMSLYALSMVMLLAVTVLNKKMDFRALGIGAGFSGNNLDLTIAGLGCIITALTIIFLGATFGQAQGGFISALAQINFFGPLGIILATAGALKDSGGRRSLNFVNTFALILFTLQGIVVFTKQGMLTPAVCYIIGVFYMRMRVRPIHVVAFILFIAFVFGFAGPLSDARDLQIPGGSITAQAGVVWYQVTHWKEFRHHVELLDSRSGHDNGAPTYFDKPQGAMIERLTMMPPDDRFNAYTAKGNYEGMAPIIEWIGNLAPRFLYPNKTNDYTGNYFAHKAGGYISADDTTTGISFSPVSSAYNCEGWGGILWLMPAIWIALFTSVDFVAGDLEKYPWGLLVVVWFGHAAPESLLSGMIYYIGYGNLGMLVAIVISTRLAPIVGSLFSGKTVVVQTRAIDRRRITPLALPTVALPQE
jgi:hypothetical protein